MHALLTALGYSIHNTHNCVFVILPFTVLNSLFTLGDRLRVSFTLFKIMYISQSTLTINAAYSHSVFHTFRQSYFTIHLSNRLHIFFFSKHYMQTVKQSHLIFVCIVPDFLSDGVFLIFFMNININRCEYTHCVGLLGIVPPQGYEAILIHSLLTFMTFALSLC